MSEMSFDIKQITTNKKQHFALLLLADEQESMIDRYLERGDMFVLEENGVKAVCVVTDEGNGVCELKNIAVTPASQRKGYDLFKTEHESKFYNQSSATVRLY